MWVIPVQAVIVFPSPSEQQIRESIHEVQLLGGQSHDAAKVVWVRHFEVCLVRHNADVPGKIQAPVVILQHKWEEINIMEKVIHLLFSFNVSDVHQHCSVEQHITLKPIT